MSVLLSLEGVKVVLAYVVVLFFTATSFLILVRSAPKFGTMLLDHSGEKVSSTRLSSFIATLTIFGAYLIVTLSHLEQGQMRLVELDANTVLLLLVAMSPVLAEKALSLVGKSPGGAALGPGASGASEPGQPASPSQPPPAAG